MQGEKKMLVRILATGRLLAGCQKPQSETKTKLPQSDQSWHKRHIPMGRG